MENQYLQSLKPVWRDLDHISVDELRLQELIRKMAGEELKTPAWAIEYVHPPLNCDPQLLVAFFSWICTVNFAFTNFRYPFNKFVIEYPRGTEWDGSFALEAAFMRAYNEGIPVFSSEYMSEISLKDVKYIFRSIDNDHQIPLLQARWYIFQEVGRVLLEKYNGSWLDLFEAGGWRAFNNGKGIVERLVADFSSFRDTRYYKGHILEFHKRAQLLVMMYHGRAANSNNLPVIKDIQDIGPIADYDVPKALASLGVLKYDPKLESAIRSHQIILTVDPFEIENRLAMSYVMAKICDELGINMAQADAYIWFKGKESKEPHILVPTTDY